jgi:hypothetical protein
VHCTVLSSFSLPFANQFCVLHIITITWGDDGIKSVSYHRLSHDVREGSFRQTGRNLDFGSGTRSPSAFVTPAGPVVPLCIDKQSHELLGNSSPRFHESTFESATSLASASGSARNLSALVPVCANSERSFAILSAVLRCKQQRGTRVHKRGTSVRITRQLPSDHPPQ